MEDNKCIFKNQVVLKTFLKIFRSEHGDRELIRLRLLSASFCEEIDRMTRNRQKLWKPGVIDDTEETEWKMFLASVVGTRIGSSKEANQFLLEMENKKVTLPTGILVLNPKKHPGREEENLFPSLVRIIDAFAEKIYGVVYKFNGKKEEEIDLFIKIFGIKTVKTVAVYCKKWQLLGLETISDQVLLTGSQQLTEIQLYGKRSCLALNRILMLNPYIKTTLSKVRCSSIAGQDLEKIRKSKVYNQDDYFLFKRLKNLTCLTILRPNSAIINAFLGSGESIKIKEIGLRYADYDFMAENEVKRSIQNVFLSFDGLNNVIEHLDKLQFFVGKFVFEEDWETDVILNEYLNVQMLYTNTTHFTFQWEMYWYSKDYFRKLFTKMPNLKTLNIVISPRDIFAGNPIEIFKHIENNMLQKECSNAEKVTIPFFDKIIYKNSLLNNHVY